MNTKSQPPLCNICDQPIAWHIQWTERPLPTHRCRQHTQPDQVMHIADTEEEAWAIITTRKLTR